MGLIFSNITMFAVAREEGSPATWSLKAEQNNHSQISVDDDPGAGERYQWTVLYNDDSDFPGFGDPLEGFGGGQSLVVSYPTDNNDKRQTADIDIQGIPASYYQTNSSATFWVKIQRESGGAFVGPYQLTVSLRTIETIDFTVFDGQSQAGTADISAPPSAASSTKYQWKVDRKHDLAIGVLAGAPIWQADVKKAPLAADGVPVSGLSEDDRFIVPEGAAAPWTSHAKEIATWDGASWSYEMPLANWAVWSVEDNQFYYMNGDPVGTGVWTGTTGTTINFDYADATQQLGRITVSNFAGNWANSSGGFTLTITEVNASNVKTSAESKFVLGSGTAASTPDIRLRQLNGDGYTIFEGQSSSSDAVKPFSGTNELQFEWDDAGLPSTATVTLDSNTGAVTGYTVPGAAWGDNGPLDLEIKDGPTNYQHRPTSFFQGSAARQVSFRQLVGDGYTIFNGQASPGSPGITTASTAGGYHFSLDGSSLPAGTTLTLVEANGAVDTFTSTAWDDSKDGSFDVEIVDGERPSSSVSRGIAFRDLDYKEFFDFGTLQTGQGVATISDVPGTTGSYSWSDNSDPDVTITESGTNSISASIRVTGGSVGSTVTFTLSITDDERPASNFTDTEVTRCSLDNTALTILDDDTIGSRILQVDGDSNTWLWHSCAYVSETGSASQTFGDTCNAASATSGGMTVDWGTTDLNAPATGHLDIVLQRANAPAAATAPTCTIEIDVTINEQVGISGDDAFTLFASRKEVGLVRQDNRPLVTVLDVPSSGDWDWAVDSVSGGGAGITAAMFDFDMQSSTTANLVWRVDALDSSTTTTVIPEAEWKATHNLTVNLRLETGRIYPITVSLRWVNFIDFYHFGALQTGQGVSSITGAPGGGGDYSWSDNGNTNITIAESGSNSVDATFTGTSGSAGTTVTYTLSITDSTRPSSDFTSAMMTRCSLDNTSLTILDDDSIGSRLLQVDGDSNGWIWDSCTFVHETGSTSQTFGDTCSSSSATTGGMTIDWGSSDLTAPCTGHFEIVLQRANAPALAIAPTCTVSVNVDIQAFVNDFDILTENNNHTLPIARERMRYSAKLHLDVPAIGSVVWSAPTTDPATPAGVFELVDELGLATNEKILQTVIDTTAGEATSIPQGWATGIPVTVTVEATMDGDTVSVDLSLAVQATAEDIDVAILLDRSGSMYGNKWAAASDGAQAFAELVAAVGSGYDHNVGVYWFHGNCWDRYSDHTDYDPNPYVGAIEDGADSFAVDTGRALTHHADIGTLCTSPPYGPEGCTAIGAGLVNCKKELNDLTNDHEKIILTLSDGMENCNPLLETVFPDGSTSSFWLGGEDMRLYFVAVLTDPSWVTTLRTVVNRTHGIPSEDVKHIQIGTSLGDTQMSIEQWFFGSFTELFDYTLINAIPDPALKGEEWNTHPVTANLGVTRIIFYVLFDQRDDGKWEFGVIPPGQENAIYARYADEYDGVRCFEGKTHKTLIVDLPLEIDGHRHRWAGDWQMVVGRTKEAGEEYRNYIVGAMARQDLDARAEIIAPSIPRTGDKATIRVELKDQNGKAIKDANVKVGVHTPGMWPGHEISMEIAYNPKLIKALRRSQSKASIDTDHLADRVLRELYDKNKIEGGAVYPLTLKHTKNGVYKATVSLKEPGNYNFEISISGQRKTLGDEIRSKIGDAKKDIAKIYHKRDLVRAEHAFLKKHSGRKQDFKIECRKQLAVQFVPTVQKSEVQGYFINEKTIRFRVQPRNKSDILLGPGWADNIKFSAPGLEETWPAIDAGDSSYWVDIPIDAKNPRFDRVRHTLVADALRLHHPVIGSLNPRDDELPLKGFGVTILGVYIPITVYALVGNKRSKETHLAACTYAKMIADKNKVFFHDLNEARRHGYDTCEWCLPIVCNMSPSKMEAHKPFCSHIRRIAKNNRLEVNSWPEAKKLGFDGCFYCLPDKHTR